MLAGDRVGECTKISKYDDYAFKGVHWLVINAEVRRKNKYTVKTTAVNDGTSVGFRSFDCIVRYMYLNNPSVCAPGMVRELK